MTLELNTTFSSFDIPSATTSADTSPVATPTSTIGPSTPITSQPPHIQRSASTLALITAQQKKSITAPPHFICPDFNHTLEKLETDLQKIEKTITINSSESSRLEAMWGAPANGEKQASARSAALRTAREHKNENATLRQEIPDLKRKIEELKEERNNVIKELVDQAPPSAKRLADLCTTIDPNYFNLLLAHPSYQNVDQTLFLQKLETTLKRCQQLTNLLQRT